MAKKAATSNGPEPASKTDTHLVREAIEAGYGILRLAPTWVPRSFLMPGRRIKLAPARHLRPRRPSRRHRRTLVRLDHGRRQRRRSARRGAQLRRPRRQAGVHAAGCHRPRRRDSWSARRSGTSTSAGRSTASSSTTWGRSRTTCTRTTSRPPWSVSRVSRSRTIFHRS